MNLAFNQPPSRILGSPPRFAVAFAFLLAALLAAGATEQTRTDAELARIQGHWEGEGAGGKCSITITNNSIRYRAGETWYEATFVLPANTHPQQMRATIKDSGPSKDPVGKVVHVVYKLEEGNLTLTTYDESGEPPKTFEGNNLYVVKKVEPGKKTEPEKEAIPAKPKERETPLWLYGTDPLKPRINTN